MDYIADTGLRGRLRGLKANARTAVQRALTGRHARRNERKTHRQLEIGPGPNRIPGFETVNVVGGRQVDYVADATKGLPFPAGSFDLIYASHVFEHIAWYRSQEVMSDWARALKPGGRLELWMPDGLKIAAAFVDAEREGKDDYKGDGWWRFNEGQDPCLWANGRIFSYGDGTGQQAHFNWHIALYSERRLREMMAAAGLTDIRRLESGEVRGHDHGWINLGLTGVKR